MGYLIARLLLSGLQLRPELWKISVVWVHYGSYAGQRNPGRCCWTLKYPFCSKCFRSAAELQQPVFCHKLPERSIYVLAKQVFDGFYNLPNER